MGPRPCRACQTPINFVQSEQGKWIPYNITDDEPTQRDFLPEQKVVDIITGQTGDAGTFPISATLRLSHMDVCPNADEFRKEQDEQAQTRPIAKTQQTKKTPSPGTCNKCHMDILWTKTNKGQNRPINLRQVDPKTIDPDYWVINLDNGVCMTAGNVEQDGRYHVTHWSTCSVPYQKQEPSPSPKAAATIADNDIDDDDIAF